MLVAARDLSLSLASRARYERAPLFHRAFLYRRVRRESQGRELETTDSRGSSDGRGARGVTKEKSERGGKREGTVALTCLSYVIGAWYVPISPTRFARAPTRNHHDSDDDDETALTASRRRGLLPIRTAKVAACSCRAYNDNDSSLDCRRQTDSNVNKNTLTYRGRTQIYAFRFCTKKEINAR